MKYIDADQIGDLFGAKSHGYVNFLMDKYSEFPRAVAKRNPARGGMPKKLCCRADVMEFKQRIDESQFVRGSIDNKAAVVFITGHHRRRQPLKVLKNHRNRTIKVRIDGVWPYQNELAT